MQVKMELLAVSVVVLGFILNVAKSIELLSLPNYYSKNTDDSDSLNTFISICVCPT